MKNNRCRKRSEIGSNLISQLFPIGSRRRNFYEMAKKSMRILSDHGFTGLYQAYKEYRAIRVIRHRNQKQWIADHILNPEMLEKMRAESDSFSYRPLISIILPVWNTKSSWLHQAIESVLQQCYQKWELCIVDDASSDPAIRTILREFQHKDTRIKVIYLERNIGIAGASNEAIAQATGDFICFQDHDDVLSLDALYEVAKFLNNYPSTDFIYSDEVLINDEGRPIFAYYKPDFSLDYLLSHPYIVHLVSIRASLIRDIRGFRSDFPVSQDYDLFLRIVSRTRRIGHIPKILYYWRIHPSSAGHKYIDKVSLLSRRAIREFLQRENIEGDVFDTDNFNFFRVMRTLTGTPLVSIIIPTRDHVTLLQSCIGSIIKLSTYSNYEIIIVDNRSSKNETKEYFEVLKQSQQNIRIIEFDEDFNFSRLNNIASRFARGEHLLFLNNDTEVISPEWIESLLEHSEREEVSCVGAKLLYPDGTIQHAGVVIGLCGPAEHVYKFSDAHDIGYMGHLTSIRNYSAVTGACLMIKKKVFESLGGFDEEFREGFGDTDLCLRAQSQGYYTVFTPFAELYHHESATRGKSWDRDNHPEDTARFRERWNEKIKEGDPYYNPNLPLNSLDIRPFVVIG